MKSVLAHITNGRNGYSKWLRHSSKPSSRHKKHEYTLDNIPEGVATEKVEHRLEGEDLICPECGSTMTEIGKTVVKTLKLVSVQTIVREDIYYTYACQNCAKNGTETPIVKAPVEKNIIPGSFAWAKLILI